jgi:hypothetical protein
MSDRNFFAELKRRNVYKVAVTHAWLKSGSDWRIIGEMSMPEPEKKAE